MIIPLVQTIEEATLPVIIFIHDVYVSLLEQDTTKKGVGVRDV